MPDPAPAQDQTLSPAAKDPAEGKRDGEPKSPAPPVPDHLGPAGDPVEGK